MGVGWDFFFFCLLACSLLFNSRSNYNKTADSYHPSLILNDIRYICFTNIILLCLVDHSACRSRTQIATHPFRAAGVAER